MKTGTGYSNKRDAFAAGREVAENAMLSQGIERADLVIAFRSGYEDHGDFLRGILSITGDRTPIIGGSAVGVITNTGLSYREFASGAAVLSSDTLTHRVICVENLDKGEEKAGEVLGNALSKEREGKLVLLFYDSIRRPPSNSMPPVLNSSSSLLKGIERGFVKNTPIIGAGLVGDYGFNYTRQFCGSHVGEQTAVGTLLDGNFNIYSRITHGCTPLDGIYYRITRMEGSFIHELDNMPVTDIIDDIYRGKGWREQQPVRLLTVGVNLGNRFDVSEESTCVNRLILGALPDGKGISLFEPDLEKGTMIRFMIRDTDEMIRSARINAEGILEDIIAKGERPVFGLYIDCAGRTAEYQNIMSEEASIIQDVFNIYGVQLFGFYSGVEIAPMPDKSRGLDWTGVLLVFSEGKS